MDQKHEIVGACDEAALRDLAHLCIVDLNFSSACEFLSCKTTVYNAHDTKARNKGIDNRSVCNAA